MLIIIIFFMTGIILIGVKRSDDLTRHIFLEAHNCYAQDKRAVLHTDGTVECRDYEQVQRR